MVMRLKVLKFPFLIRRRFVLVASLALLIGLAAPAVSSAASAPAAPGAPVTSSTAGPAGAITGSGDDFRNAQFSKPLRIDNKWSPVVPGIQTVSIGTVQGVPHRLVRIVTDLYKVIDGVRTAVVWESDYSPGQLEESELFFVAQDDNRNIWLFGETPEVYSNGHLQGAPDTWIGGIADAKEGIFQLGAPRLGSPAFSEGLALNVGFEDRGRVFQMGQSVCVPLGCYHDVLVIDEWSPLDPRGGHQRKFYAPGVGNVFTAPAGGNQPETLSLTSLVSLDPTALAAARATVLQQDQRAYTESKAYAHTPPPQPR
jgi:hypothetical protein